MNEENKNDPLMSETDFRVGYDNEKDPNVMVFNVPLKACAENLEYGSALVRGKLDEAKQIALRIISEKRMRKAKQTALFTPNGDLKVY